MPTKRVTGARRRRGSRQKPGDDNFNLTSKGGDVVFTAPKVSTMRRATAPIVLAKGVADQGFGQSFELAQLINFAEIQSLYDQYCIDKVQYVIELATPFISNGVYPYVAVAPDYTDVTAPVSASGVLELAQAKVFQFSPDRTRFSITLKPRPALSAYASAVSTGYMIPSGDTWFASVDSGVDHYGLKIWIQDYNTTISNITALRGFAVFHLKLRGSK